MKLERLLGWPSEPRTVADLRGRGYNFDAVRLRELELLGLAGACAGQRALDLLHEPSGAELDDVRPAVRNPDPALVLAPVDVEPGPMAGWRI